VIDDPRQYRVLVLAQGRDALLTRQMLLEGKIDAHLSSSAEMLYEEMSAGTSAVIVAQEFLTVGFVSSMKRWLDEQPAWSDLPIILVAGGPEQAAGIWRSCPALGNVSVLQRPIAIDTFLTTVQTALRARRRQYQIRDLLAEQIAADQRKDEFLAMLAHELRNPLAPIRSATELMTFWNLPEPEQQEVLEIVRRQVSHMARLLDDLLDVSRITRGKISLDKRLVDVGEIIENAARGVVPLIKQKGHLLEQELPEVPLYVEADATRIHQIISNLLHNSAKYTDPGGKIKLTARREDPWCVISVCDNGVGIAATILPRIFDLFAQGERSIDRGAGGLGIGLTVVKSLVDLHGGTVTVLSDGRECGTEVIVKLPLAAPPAAAPPSPLSSEKGAVRQRRVLIVDDNADGAQTLARLVRAWGHTVQVVYDAHDGLRAGREYRPDVYLLDIGLPGMDGYELARCLQREPWFNGAKLVAVTGYGQEGDRERARQAGFHAHLVKPVDPLELQEQVAGPPISPPYSAT
jgi:signal transduction histidine kinase/CheY-like chemotaxis protein